MKIGGESFNLAVFYSRFGGEAWNSTDNTADYLSLSYTINTHIMFIHNNIVPHILLVFTATVEGQYSSNLPTTVSAE